MAHDKRFAMQDLKYMLKDFFALRRVRRALLICLAVIGVWLLWRWRRGPEGPLSAVGCKNRIAQIAIPDKKERQKYLGSLSQDVLTLENEYYNQLHFGPPEDGGWEVCVDPQYDLKPPCLVYSFGIGNDFRFEKGVEKQLQCEVHSFDPSMGVTSHKYSEKGFFHDFGIDNADTLAVGGRWKMKRLKTIMKELGHEGRTIDYLKMDVEFSEWLAVQDLLKTGLHKQIRQLAMEVHTPEMDMHHRRDHRCTWSVLETWQFMLQTLLDLRNHGFSLYYSRTNYRTLFKSPLTGHERYCCHNLHFVNSKHVENRHQDLRF